MITAAVGMAIASGDASANELRFESPRVHGALETDLVLQRLRANVGAMKRCYRKHYHRARKRNWIVRLRFTVTHSGWVSWARTKHGGKHLQRCLDVVVKRIVFPKPRRGVAKVHVYIRRVTSATAQVRPPPSAKPKRKRTPPRRTKTARPAPPPAPAPKKPAPAATGSSQAELGALMRTHARPLRQCYEAARKRKPHLRGKVVVAFDVGKEGRVSAVRARGLDSGVAACVARVIRGIRFAAVPNGGAIKVTYPIHFPIAAARW